LFNVLICELIMSKFSNRRVKLGETKVFVGFRIYQSDVDAIKELHDNVSEWVRDAVLEKLDREKQKTEEAIKKIESRL